MRKDYFDDTKLKELVYRLHLNYFYQYDDDVLMLEHHDDFDRFWKNGKWHSKFDGYCVNDTGKRLDVIEIKERIDDRRLYFIDETKLIPFMDNKNRHRWNFYYYFVLPDGVWAVNVLELGIDWNDWKSTKVSAGGIVRVSAGKVLRNKFRYNSEAVNDKICYGLDVDVRFFGIKITDKLIDLDEEL